MRQVSADTTLTIRYGAGQGWAVALFIVLAALFGFVALIAYGQPADHVSSCNGRGCLVGLLPKPWREALSATLAMACVAAAMVVASRIAGREVFCRIGDDGVWVRGLLKPVQVSWSDIKTIVESDKAVHIEWRFRSKKRRIELRYSFLDVSADDLRRVFAHHRPDLVGPIFQA